VRDISENFGINAGQIWSVLNEKGNLKKDELLKETSLNESDFHAAVGWLARENKISCYDEDYFKLEETNLEAEIGEYAGRVWNLLDIWNEIDFESMKTLSNLDDNQVYSALGWLAREDKIKINDANHFTLKN